MDCGVCVATESGEVFSAAQVENLGFSHAWSRDSQLIGSDCYAYLALAAPSARSMKIGTGLHPAEVEFATPELLRKTCLAGTAQELPGQLRALAAAGMAHVIILPSREAQYRNAGECSHKVMARL